MAEIGVECLPARRRQEDGAEGQQSDMAMLKEEHDARNRVERLEDGRIVHDVQGAEHAHDDEPE